MWEMVKFLKGLEKYPRGKWEVILTKLDKHIIICSWKCDIT